MSHHLSLRRHPIANSNSLSFILFWSLLFVSLAGFGFLKRGAHTAHKILKPEIFSENRKLEDPRVLEYCNLRSYLSYVLAFDILLVYVADLGAVA